MITGVILGSPDGAIYVTGLGNALLRLQPEAQSTVAQSTAAQSTAAQSKAALHDFATRYAADWSSQDPERLASFYIESGVLLVNDNTPATGRAAIAAKAADFMRSFPDMFVTVDYVRNENGHVVFGWIWTGINTGPGGTGRSINIRGRERWTLSPAGRIARSQGQYDEADYERQMRNEPAAR